MGTVGARFFLRTILLVAVMAGVGCLVAYSQDTSSQEARKARLEKEIAILDGQLRANAAQSSSALSKLTLISRKVAARRELVKESDQLVASYSKTIASKEREIARTQAELDTLSFYHDRLVRNAYKNRDSRLWYMLILASDNVGQAFRRYAYLRDLSKQMNVQAGKIRDLRAGLEEERSALAALKAEAETVRAARVAEMNALQAEEDESRAIVDQLGRNRRSYQQQLSRKRDEVMALNREIERIIRQAVDGGSGKSSKGKTAKPIDYTLAKEFEANKGKLPWPVEGVVVDHFGQHYHPVYTNVKLPFNNGVSLAVPIGEGVKAVFDGEVKQIVVMPGYSKCVLVQHGSYFSFYCKLGEVFVKAGDKVKTSQLLGTVDSIDGESQLHFQVWSGKTPQNPETWLRPL